MRKSIFLTLLLPLFSFDRMGEMERIEKIMEIYQKRLSCLKEREALECIAQFPLEPRGDALARTFAMSFPKAYYAAKLKRDMEILERERLCYGKSLTQEDLESCLKEGD
ncbi:MAG: hypothetical protein GXO19_02760 [Epsilonproteobacteria bacterium]|nr:hypothetical protein [Campylobacterota bacterium]NPA56640.1 hypothetical protein [Campylobacterota bacterium]